MTAQDTPEGPSRSTKFFRVGSAITSLMLVVAGLSLAVMRSNRMGGVYVALMAFADLASVTNEDCADHRIRAGEGFAVAREVKSAGHPIFSGARKWERCHDSESAAKAF